LPDIIVKEYVQFGPNTPYGQEFTKISQKYLVDPCCDFVKGVLTQNKYCRHMF